MLTNMHYFGFYRPYIIKECNETKIDKPNEYQNIGFTKMKLSKGKIVLLNKAYNSEVIESIKGIAQSIVNLRTAIKKLESSKDMYRKHYLFTYYNNEKEEVAEDIKIFFDCLNDINEIINDKNNLKLNIDFREEINMIKNDNYMKLYFAQTDDGVGIIFDKAKFDKASRKNNLIMLDKLGLFILGVKNELELFLIEPISTYMKFINLSCYYNYKIENAKEDTIKIIQNGLMFDIFL